MKSSFELAMEKYGDEPIKKLSEDQKKALAEIDNKYQAKIAEAKIMHDQKLKAAYGDLPQIEQIKNDLAVETASINERCEREKDRIRNESK